MINIVEAVHKQVQTRIKRLPCKSNRASSIGYYVPSLNGCVRMGVLERTRWQEKDLPDVRVQMIYDEGNREEKAVMRMLDDAGITVNEQQSAGEWDKYNITWHLDGVILDGDKAVPVEIKSMAPHIYDSMNTLEDFLKKPWTRAYLAQIQVYLLAKNVEHGIFILKNKSTGQIKTIDVKLDYALAEECIKTCEQINSHVADGTLPDRITDVEVCKNCKMKTACAPGINFGTELKIADDPEFENRVSKYLDMKVQAKECDDLYDLIRERIKATAGGKELKILVGPFQITGKPDAKGALRVTIERL